MKNYLLFDLDGTLADAAGTSEMLRALHSKGMSLAAFSERSTAEARQVLERLQAAKYFRAVAGSGSGGADREAVMREALCQLFDGKPIDKEKVYVVVARGSGVEGAHAVGAEAVGVACDSGGMEELKSAKADYIVRSVGELQRFLLRGAEERKLTPAQRIWQIVLPFLLFLLVRDAVATFAALSFASLEGNAPAVVSAAGFLAAAAAIFPIAKKTIRRGAEDRKLLHLKKEPAKRYVLFGIATIGLVVGLNLLLELLGAVEASDAYQEVAKRQHAAWLPVGLLCYGVISAISEELLFRGIVYNCFRRYLELQTAMTLSAALFAIYHGNAVQGIYAFAMGCFMVYGYEYFGEFKMPAIAHMLANLLAYGISAAGGIPEAARLPVCAAGLLCGVGGVWLMHRGKKVF